MSLLGGSTVPSTLATTEALRPQVEAKMLPLFDHLIKLARSSAAAGYSQRAGRELRQARKLAGDVTPRRPPSDARKIPRVRLGELMTHWHGSMGDPYYAVGSYYLSDKPYPTSHVVVRALEQAEADAAVEAERASRPMPMAKQAARNVTELRTIAKGLRYYLRHDYGVTS